jgi:CRISPR/Cas system-associated exonuclease Cas4 (RecB family)
MAQRIRLLESPSAHERLRAASAFLASMPAGTDVLAVGASREAIDDLVREHSAERGAAFGIHRFGLWQLVSHVASTELASAGLAPATPLGAEAVAARATFDAASRRKIHELADLVSFPGFPRALASTIDEHRLHGDDAAVLRAAGDAFGELAELTALYEREIERAHIADRATLLRLATWAWRRPHHAALRNAPLLLLDVPATSRRLNEFLKGLLQSCPRALVTIPAEDHAARRAFLAGGAVAEPVPPSAEADALVRLRRHLFSPEAPPEAEPDASVRFFSAPGESRECVEIARGILAAARDGMRFDEIAVLLRAPELYSAHLETAFRRADVPAHFARGTRRPDPSGRAFLALLACRAERLSARRFAEYLSFAQVPEPGPDGGLRPEKETWVASKEETLAPRASAVQLGLFAAIEEAPAPSLAPATDEAVAFDGSLRAPWKWEEYLVEAAVIGGRDRWKRRLAGLERELQRKRDESAAEEPGSPRVARLERELANLGHLERFALPTIDALDALPRKASWGDWLDALMRLAPRVLRKPQHVLEVLAEMRPMAEVGPVQIDEVRGILHERLSDLEEDPPALRFGCVFVGTPEGVRGRSFRLVYVPGLAERLFPRPPREDPLLSDDARKRLAHLAGRGAESPSLRTQDDRADEERQKLRLAIGAARERVVLSYPRVDVRQARPRVPSFYLLDVVRATRGFLPDHETLERQAAGEADARLAWPAPEDPAHAIDDAEYDLSVLARLFAQDPDRVRGRARWLFEVNEHLARSLRTRWIRWRFKQWWPDDGIVRVTPDTTEALAAHRPAMRPYSPTSLEKYSVCPYRFLLDAIHRLEPREDVAPLVQLDPLTRGSIVHAIQAETLRALDDNELLPIGAGTLARATEMLDETIERVEAREREELAPAIERVWKDEIGRIRADLRIWLRRMADGGASWTPEYFEFAFGMERPPRSDPRSTREPARVDGWQLRGAIDLVERSPDGDWRVTDHKTGIARAPEGVIVGKGEVLQPVLYAVAVEAVLGGKTKEARLSYCTSRGGFVDRVVPMNDFARLYTREVLSTVSDAIETGCFPPAPRPDACATCDFRVVCGPFEESRQRRKDPAMLAKLDALRRLP